MGGDTFAASREGQLLNEIAMLKERITEVEGKLTEALALNLQLTQRLDAQPIESQCPICGNYW